MRRPRVKHPVYGWGRIVKVLHVYTKADGPRLQDGDVAALVRFDDQHRYESPRHVVINASMRVEHAAALAELIRRAQ